MKMLLQTRAQLALTPAATSRLVGRVACWRHSSSSYKSVSLVAAKRHLAGVSTHPSSSFHIPTSEETVLLGCVSYDPAVSNIWSQLKTHFVSNGVPNFDFVLFTNYEQQVRALLSSQIDIAWNGPIAHVLCEQYAPAVVAPSGATTLISPSNALM
jgi:ABC-type phosphate/phosphonate transport system substrate-binding protein